MKLFIRIALAVIVAMIFFSCSKTNKNNSIVFPAGCVSDTAKIAFVMQHAAPDSVARFICNTILGLNDSTTINSLQDAILHAYSNYSGTDLKIFSNEFDSYVNNLPIRQKMQVIYFAAKSNPDGLGYKLGLEYAMRIQTNKIALSDIDTEINELKSACDKDNITYLRILNGISIALSMPEYSHLPQEILNKYAVKVEVPYTPTPANQETVQPEINTDSLSRDVIK